MNLQYYIVAECQPLNLKKIVLMTPPPHVILAQRRFTGSKLPPVQRVAFILPHSGK